MKNKVRIGEESIRARCALTIWDRSRRMYLPVRGRSILIEAGTLGALDAVWGDMARAAGMTAPEASPAPEATPASPAQELPADPPATPPVPARQKAQDLAEALKPGRESECGS